MNNGFNNIFLIVALVATSFVAGRFYANSSLMEENQKLKESVRLLRGEKMGIVQPEPLLHALWGGKTSAPPAATTPAREAETRQAATVETPPASPTTAAQTIANPVVEKTRAEVVAAVAPAVKPTPPQPEPSPAQNATETAAPAPLANSKKTAKKWVSDLGDNVQGTATYWRCNNATLAASGMDYYAYGSIPASRLKNQADAYSVRDGKAIVISGCWSQKLGKAILYRKSDGRRWEPPFNVDNGSWTPLMD